MSKSLPRYNGRRKFPAKLTPAQSRLRDAFADVPKRDVPPEAQAANAVRVA